MDEQVSEIDPGLGEEIDPIESEVLAMPDSDSTKAWQQWKSNPSPQTMAVAVNSVRPVIDKAVSKYSRQNPAVMGGEAKRLAIAAIKTYDPARGTKLQSHVFSHLKPLGRNTANLGKAIQKSRGDRDLSGKYYGAVKDLSELSNREPSDAELMDHLKIDRKILFKMRRASVGEVAESQAIHLPEMEDEEDPRLAMWADYVYADLPPMDQKIMDLKLGRSGNPMMSAAEIAAKMGISEVYVNKKAEKIANRILEGANQ